MAEFQPPEGLRKILADAYDHHATTVYPQRTQPGRWSWACRCGAKSYGETYEAIELAHVPARNHFADAVLAALFEACEVHEDFPMTYTTPYTKLPREVVHKVREGAVVGARMYTQEGFTPVKVEHRWTLTYKQPVMRMYDDGEPVSSTGEEPTDGE